MVISPLEEGCACALDIKQWPSCTKESLKFFFDILGLKTLKRSSQIRSKKDKTVKHYIYWVPHIGWNFWTQFFQHTLLERESFEETVASQHFSFFSICTLKQTEKNPNVGLSLYLFGKRRAANNIDCKTSRQKKKYIYFLSGLVIQL